MIKKLFSVNDVKKKIALTIFYILVIAIMNHFKQQCIFIRLFNIPCPGCGMTRAFTSLLNFDILGAFGHHLMFWSVPILYLYFWFDGHIFKKNIDTVIISTIFVGFLLNWVKNLFF